MNRAEADKIADALVAVLNPQLSLRQMDEAGLLRREWAIYAAALDAPAGVSRVVVLSFGDATDAQIAARLDPRLTVVDARSADWTERLRQATTGCQRVVVKTNQMEAGDLAIQAAATLRAAGARVGLIGRGGYLWSQFLAFEQGPASKAAIDAGLVEQRLCRTADLIVGTTREMLTDLSWRYGVTEARSAHVPNYVLAEDLPADEPRARGQILASGRLVPQKRFDRLVESLGTLRDDLRSGVTLTIVGSGPLEAALKDQAAGMGVNLELVTSLSHDAFMERLRRCSMFVQTSAFEAHSKTVIEAMSVGTPVVVCDSPGVRGVVKHAITGLCVQPDPDSIRLAVEGLLDDPDWGETLGMAAAGGARSVYALERIIDQELATYARALELGATAATHAVDVRSAVRWTPDLIATPVATQIDAFARSIRAFATRLQPIDRARFVLGLDTPLEQLAGEVAIDADGGLHPKHRLMKYHDFFVERIAPGERVIDLGCGVGALAASIAARCKAHVTGLDLDDAKLAQARRIAADQGIAGRIELIKGDITTHRVTHAAGFDVLVLSNVLEHVPRRPELLRQWVEWYRPTRVLIRVPAFDREWQVPFKRELGVEWRLDDTHETEYTRADLERELVEAGLDLRELITRWGELWVAASPAGHAAPEQPVAAARVA
jgi:SAM-dependent methyltransferase